MRVPVIEAALTAPDSQGTSTNANSLALTVLRYTFPVFHAATNSAPLGGASGRRCPIPRSACLGPDRNVSRRPRRYPRGVGGNRAALGDLARRFETWVCDYRPGAEMDHGYGFTRIRNKPQSPAPAYLRQLDSIRPALLHGDAASRRQAVEAALEDAKIA